MTPKIAGRDDRRFTENPAAEFVQSPGLGYPYASPETGSTLPRRRFPTNGGS